MRTEFLAILLSIIGCRGNVARTTACDLDSLTELGDALGTMPLADQASHVWPALVDACGQRAIPGPVLYYFAPEASQGTLARERGFWSTVVQHNACPGLDAIARANMNSGSLGTVIFKGCDFSRYEVLDIEEIDPTWSPIMIFATHQWLLDLGLDPRAAKPITRALYALDAMRGWGISHMDEIRWPKAHGAPWSEGIPVYVNPSFIASQPGHRVSMDNLDSGLARAEILAKEVAELGRGRETSLLIVADAKTPMPTIMGLIHAAARDGFTHYGFFVEPESFVPTHIPFVVAGASPSSPEVEPQRTPPVMSIEFTPEGVTLSRGRGQDPAAELLPFTDLDAVSNFARELRREAPEARRVVVSAAETVPLEAVLVVIAAARGPECSETGASCVLPDVVLVDGGAHRYLETPSLHDGSVPAVDGIWSQRGLDDTQLESGDLTLHPQ